jgi:hypothetical protein
VETEEGKEGRPCCSWGPGSEFKLCSALNEFCALEQVTSPSEPQCLPIKQDTKISFKNECGNLNEVSARLEPVYLA